MHYKDVIHQRKLEEGEAPKRWHLIALSIPLRLINELLSQDVDVQRV